MSSVTVLRTFWDEEAGAYRYAGEAFEAAPARAAAINETAKAKGFGPFVEAAPERKQAEPAKAAPGRREQVG